MTPEQIVEHGLNRSPVLMVNEAHDGSLRCVRTRRLGRSLLPAMHRNGVRILALEALDENFARKWNQTRQVEQFEQEMGYIGQPDLRDLMQAALDLGWELRGYDLDVSRYTEKFAWMTHASRETVLSQPYIQWREDEQARNLLEIFKRRDGAGILVWCGNGHHAEQTKQVSLGPGFELRPMGLVFKDVSGVDPFTIDQSCTVEWPGSGQSDRAKEELELHRATLEKLGGSAGYLVETESAESFDALILSVDNKFE